jgi:hypothetical protein
MRIFSQPESQARNSGNGSGIIIETWWPVFFRYDHKARLDPMASPSGLVWVVISIREGFLSLSDICLKSVFSNKSVFNGMQKYG